MTPEILINFIAVIVFGLLLVISAFRLRFKEAAVLHLTLFIALGFFSNLSQLTYTLGITPLTGTSFNPLTELLLLAMILVFGALTLSFLKKHRGILIGYWGVSVIILALWTIFTPQVRIWGDIPISPDANSVLIVAEFDWVMPIVVALIALSIEFRHQQSAKHLNRLRYWLIATTLLAMSGLAFFINPTNFYWSGLPLALVGSVIASYIILSYHTADLNLFIGRVIHYVSVTGVLAVIFYLSLVITVIVSRSTFNPGNVFFWSVALAIVLAIVIPLLWRNANRFSNRIIFGNKNRDERQVIKHYSQSVSGTLDMDRLANIIINLMIETLGIEQGVVLVNDRTGASGVSLRPLASIGVTNLKTGRFNANSPFVSHFRNNHKYLHQYDVDVLPEYSSMRDEERTWLSSMGMELHVPIMRSRDIIGMLCFGPQASGTAYYEEDIELMIDLADQSSLAIDSAQLFEQLASVNRQVGLLSERLEGLDQDKADFLSIASHELRTPLTQILGYSQMLLDLTEEELSDPNFIKTMTEGIAKGSERMKDVIDVMFDVTEAHIGEMSLFSGPVDLAEVIDQASRPFLSALDERRIAFGTNGFDDLPTIEADGTRLVQALENLISNAIKYTPDGGVVRVEGRPTVMGDSTPAVELLIIDNGIGIDPRYHDRIFEKVFRIDDADHHSTGKTKFKGGGPGLGLALVKAIAETHGGQVWVESPGYDEVNRPGSKFFFVIPMKPIKIEQKEGQKQSQIETIHWRSKDLKPTNN